MVQLLQHLGIRTKILLCASLIQIAIVLTTSAVYSEITQSQQRAQMLLQATRVANTTEALHAELSTMDISARSYILSGNSVFLDPYAHAYFAAVELLETLAGQIENEPGQQARLQDVAQQIERWRTEILIPAMTQRETLDVNTPNADALMAERARDAKRAYDRLGVRLDLVRTFEHDLVEQREQEAQSAAARLKVTLLWSMALLLVGGIGTFWLLASNIAQRVRRVTQAATQMAQGDLASRCRLRTAHDEIGQLAHAFNTMAEALQQHATELQVQYRAAEEARRDAERAHGQVMTQLATIEQQHAVIREMTVPVLPLDGTTLVMPLIGALDSTRLRLVQDQAVHALERSGARQLILDVTGVPIVDTQVAQGLLQVTNLARLLGADVYIVGIRPEVAQALVGLNLDVSHFKTYSTLQQGIAHTMTRSLRQHEHPLFH